MKHAVHATEEAGLKLTKDKRLTDLCYADDVALIDDSVDGLQAMILSVAYWSEKVGLSINVAKTKWMAVGNSSNGNGQLMMNGEQMEPVEEFCYLGSILTNNGNCCKDVQTRIAKANLAFSRFNNIWRDRKLGLPIKTVHLDRESNPSLQCRNLAFDQTRDSTSRGCTPKWLRRILNV